MRESLSGLCCMLHSLDGLCQLSRGEGGGCHIVGGLQEGVLGGSDQLPSGLQAHSTACHSTVQQRCSKAQQQHGTTRHGTTQHDGACHSSACCHVAQHGTRHRITARSCATCKQAEGAHNQAGMLCLRSVFKPDLYNVYRLEPQPSHVTGLPLGSQACTSLADQHQRPAHICSMHTTHNESDGGQVLSILLVNT